MRELELIVLGNDVALKNMYVNGKKQKLKNLEGNKKIAKVKLEQDKAEVVICKYHNYMGKLWWLTNIFYFLISLFGILDIKKDKTCTVVDCRFNLTLSQDVTKAYLSVLDNGEKYMQIDTIAEKEELSNIKYQDEVGKKRKKISKKINFLTFALCVIGTIVLVVLLKK